jgi:hypothetical protein
MCLSMCSHSSKPQDAADAARAQAESEAEPDRAELDALAELAELARRHAEDEPEYTPEYA